MPACLQKLKDEMQHVCPKGMLKGAHLSLPALQLWGDVAVCQ